MLTEKKELKSVWGCVCVLSFCYVILVVMFDDEGLSKSLQWGISEPVCPSAFAFLNTAVEQKHNNQKMTSNVKMLL